MAESAFWEHLVEWGVPDPFSKIMTGAAIAGDFTGMMLDELQGDQENANKHAMDMVWDTGSLLAPPGVDKAIDGVKTVKDLTDEDAEHDETGDGSKWGALAGLTLPGMLMGGPIGGALIGGLIGASSAPKAGHMFDGNALGAQLGAAGAEIAHPSAPIGPPLPPTLGGYLATHPFAHWL